MPRPPAKKKRIVRLAIIVGVVLVGILLVLAWNKKRHAVQPVVVTTEKAVVRTITQVVTATGKIQPEVEVKITAEVYGEIVDLPFREGARVRKGDLIVRIKPDLYQAQVDQQTASVSVARGQAVHSKAALAKAESDLRQYTDLHERGLATDADYVLYKTNEETAKADYAAALANVQEQEGLLGQAKDALSKTVIYSPMDGTVSSRSAEVGEGVVAQGNFTGTEIMRVADLSHMEVRVNVNENDIPNVKVGDHALISIDAFPDRKVNGIVREIAASAANAGATGSGSTQTSSSDEVTNFVVKIRVEDRDLRLRPGMSATADIQTQTARDVVAVPIQSVTVRAEGGLTSDEFREKKAAADREKSGNEALAASDRQSAKREGEELKKVVFVKLGDKVQLRPVETGIADDTWIEIKKGVKPGEEVVSGTYAAISRTLKDGTVVKVEPPKKEASVP